MNDLSYLDPAIEVAAEAPRLFMIQQRLKQRGMRPYAVKLPIDFEHTDPLLIDMQTVSTETLQMCARAQMMGLPRKLIMLQGRAEMPPISDALVVQNDAGLAVLPSQLQTIARREASEREYKARRATAVSLGGSLPSIDPSTAPHLLYLGNGSPTFLALRSALVSRGVKVTAALTKLTAETYLAQNTFTAILLDVSDGYEIDSDHSLFMDRLVCVMIANTEHVSDRQTNVIGAASEVLLVSTPIDELASRLEILSRKYLASVPSLPDMELSSVIGDNTTGFFSRQFMESHLERQMQIAGERAEPLCVFTLKISQLQGIHFRRLQKNVAEVILRMLRRTDCPAAIGGGYISISLPMTPYRGGTSMGERIANAVSEIPGLSGASISWRIVEKRAYHTATTLLGAGLAGPYAKVIAA